MPIIFQKRDRDYFEYHTKVTKARWRPVQRKGTIVDVGGSVVELFRIGVLCEAIDRTKKNILLWESNGIFPKPLFQVDGGPKSGQWRWYSAEQILNMHRVMFLRWAGKKYLQKKEDFEGFMKDIRTVFYQRKVVVGNDGRIEGEDASVVERLRKAI